MIVRGTAFEIARNYRRRVRVRLECSRGWSTWANVIFRGGRLHRSIAKNIKGDTHAERCEERRAISPIGTGHQSRHEKARIKEGEILWRFRRVSAEMWSLHFLSGPRHRERSPRSSLHQSPCVHFIVRSLQALHLQISIFSLFRHATCTSPRPKIHHDASARSLSIFRPIEEFYEFLQNMYRRWMHNVGNRSRLLRISLFLFLGNETVCFTALRYTREARIIQWVWNYAAKVYDRMTYEYKESRVLFATMTFTFPLEINPNGINTNDTWHINKARERWFMKTE